MNVPKQFGNCHESTGFSLDTWVQRAADAMGRLYKEFQGIYKVEIKIQTLKMPFKRRSMVLTSPSRIDIIPELNAQ
jgi:hypothetical protein